MQETLAQRVFEEMVVSGLDEGNEHGALPPGLVGDEDLVVHLDLAVDVVDVVLCEGDGLVQHVLELWQHARNLSKVEVWFYQGENKLPRRNSKSNSYVVLLIGMKKKKGLSGPAIKKVIFCGFPYIMLIFRQ